MDELLEQKNFYLQQIEYMENALAQYKEELAKVEAEIIAQTAAA